MNARDIPQWALKQGLRRSDWRLAWAVPDPEALPEELRDPPELSEARDWDVLARVLETHARRPLANELLLVFRAALVEEDGSSRPPDLALAEYVAQLRDTLPRAGGTRGGFVLEDTRLLEALLGTAPGEEALAAFDRVDAGALQHPELIARAVAMRSRREPSERAALEGALRLLRARRELRPSREAELAASAPSGSAQQILTRGLQLGEPGPPAKTLQALDALVDDLVDPAEDRAQRPPGGDPE